MLEGTSTVQRPEAATPFEAYAIDKFDKIEHILERVVENQEIHDTKFEAIFYCFGKHYEQLEEHDKKIEPIRLNEKFPFDRVPQPVDETYFLSGINLFEYSERPIE